MSSPHTRRPASPPYAGWPCCCAGTGTTLTTLSRRRFVIATEDGVPGDRPLSLNLATRSWSLGPKAPVPGRQEAQELWTGSEVLVWGGGIQVGNTCCTAVAPGYSYTL